MLEKKYYSVEEASQCLGVTPAEVNLLREKHELHGYRDGSAWKYKVEDVDAMAKERRLKEKLASVEPGEETGDVLLSELALGGSDAGSSGTVIGGAEKKGPHDSDLRLADSDVKIGGPLSAVSAGSGKGSDKGSGKGSDKGSGKGSDKGSDKGKAAPAASMMDEAEVTLVEGITLDEGITTLDEGISLDEPKPAAAHRLGGDSAVDLDSGGKKLDDDNVVLGGSGTGSDITIGGDSGISLVDPTDSGLSLEEPLELERSDEDSLELGEDDMLTFSEEADTDAPTQLRTDEDFMLAPPEESPEEDSESGSQVIALDTERPSDSAPTVLAAGPAPAPAAMLDEDFSAAADVGLAAAAVPAAGALGVAQGPFPETAMVPAQVGEMVPEAPYSGLNIAALAVCTLVLILGGMMVYDLVRNMWSWNGSYTVSSKLMDLIVGHK